MDLASFADRLQGAIIAGLADFRSRHLDETPYGFALIGGQCGNYLGYAVATEQGLQRVAAKYDRIGYRYQAWEWEAFDNRQKLATWLRWANPDDGWFYGDFPEQFELQLKLRTLVEAAMFGPDADDLEEFCTNVLTTMPQLTQWRAEVEAFDLIVGYTDGEDPRNFLRTATRANRYRLVRRLWHEVWEADELDSRIKPP